MFTPGVPVVWKTIEEIQKMTNGHDCESQQERMGLPRPTRRTVHVRPNYTKAVPPPVERPCSCKSEKQCWLEAAEWLESVEQDQLGGDEFAMGYMRAYELLRARLGSED